MTNQNWNSRQISDSVLRHSYGYSMGSLWQSLSVNLSTDDVSFEDRAELFILFLRELMSSGSIRLASNGEYLDGSIDEQLEKLRQAWPSADLAGEDEMYFWFLVEAPAGIVWFPQAALKSGHSKNGYRQVVGWQAPVP